MDLLNVPESAAAQRRTPSPSPGVEPIPGYRLVERLGAGGFGEVWKAQAPGGLLKAIKFVLAELHPSGEEARQEREALQRVKEIRHPFLLSLERIEVRGGDLIIVTELADRSLHDVWLSCRARGEPGIPRPQLLAWLAEAAEALDHLNFQHDLQHLDVKPKNVFLVSDHVKVGDFGLVQCLREMNAPAAVAQFIAAARFTGLTPLYMPPEVLQGVFSRNSDQYSLAVVYQELLTGLPPFRGRSSRELAFQHARESPDLSPVPEADRPILARALDKDPGERFPSCREFVRALAEADRGPEAPRPTRPGAAAELEKTRLVRAQSGPTAERGSLLAAKASGEFLPGFRFLNCLSRTPASEVWLAEEPGGRQCLARCVYGLPEGPLNGVRGDPLDRLLSIDHPGLVPAELVHREPARAVLLGELPEKTLRDRLAECQARKSPGVPRDELLRWLRAVAETLDALARRHSLLHLGLNPGNLVLDRGRVRVAEFGLAHALWLPAGQPVAQINLRYSAPELFDRQVHRASDQYSLALIYCELLTGAHPLHGQPRPRSQGERFRCKPDLRLLAAADRDAVSRALSVDPRRRFAGCEEFIRALEENVAAPPEPREAAEQKSTAWPPVIAWPLAGRPALSDPGRLLVPGQAAQALTASPVTAVADVTPEEVLARVLAGAAGGRQMGKHDRVHYVLQPGDLLEHRCAARLPPGVARLKLDGFVQQWGAEVVREAEDQFVLRLGLPGSFWQRCLGTQPGLEVQVRLLPQRRATTLTEVNVALRPVGCGRDQAVRVLGETGPGVLESLRNFLQAYPEQRRGQRLRWEGKVTVCQVPDDLSPPRYVEGRVRDVSLTGVGFVLPGAPSAAQVYVNLAAAGAEAVAMLAKVVRVRPVGNGWFEVGARFGA